MPDTSAPPAQAPESTVVETGHGAAPAAPAIKQEERPPLDPTRYGDWEKNGRCIDF